MKFAGKSDDNLAIIFLLILCHNDKKKKVWKWDKMCHELKIIRWCSERSANKWEKRREDNNGEKKVR